MALFIDSHVCGEVPDEALLRALEAAEGRHSAYANARPIDYLVGKAGKIFCIVEGADEQSVRELHEEIGFPNPSELMIVEGAQGLSPLSNADRDLVLRLIQ